MRKLLSIILFIISILSLSCNNNKSLSTSSIGKVGEIIVDPYGLAPLSAIYITESVNSSPITVTVKGLYGEPDIIHTYPAGYGTEFEIHGMFPESQNIIEVNDGGRIITKNINIGQVSIKGISIPSKFTVEVNNLPEEKYPNNPDIYFMSFTGSLYPSSLGVSKNGYLRYVNNKLYFIRIMYNNKTSYLWDQNTGITTLAGKYILQYPNTIKTHHDAIKYNDQYFCLSETEFGREDGFTILNSSGNVVKELRFATLIRDIVKDPNEISILNEIIFDENNKYLQNGVAKWIDWFHANSLVYDPSKDILYVSSRHRGVLAIDYSEWKLIWWMADNNMDTAIGTGYGQIPYDKHFEDLPSLKPYRVMGDGATDGPRNQHALFLLANGNLGMFDNNGDVIGKTEGSRYVEYEIKGEHGNYIATKKSDNRGENIYSRTSSDVDYTSDNNILMLYADPQAKLLEIEKSTDKVLFKLVTSYFGYRVEKMPLYYDDGRVYSEDYNLKNLH